ncbi:MAG: hypothetical protein N3D82_05610 [Ignisphaera sp.]|nr:hypothetical protein [Ignisphaera sp.]MCX8168482.1 hypothetical protein [Ignisphaera sp.]MDW8085078.1 hypothetical protein [Ignisphaera sp.]
MVIYGEAGSGKTNIMLNMLLCSKPINSLYYISTEGSIFLNRVLSLGISSENILFSIALDQDHLAHLIIDIIAMGRSPQAVFIDSINHFYRVESVDQRNIRMFLNILALLDVISYKSTYVIASAQVKADEYGEIVAGYEYLSMWAECIAVIEKSSNRTRLLRFVKPPIDLKFKFLVTGNGIKWLTET